MKRIVVLLIIISLPLILGFGGGAPQEQQPAEQASYPYLLDNFEDGNYVSGPEWYVFDNIKLTMDKNSKLTAGDKTVVANAGTYSLNIKGNTSGWYVGGMGAVLDMDATKYDSFNIDIYGNGDKSGKIKIELYDDDNGNKDIEVDKSYIPTNDDLYAYEIDVNWTGWKHLSIPFSKFTLVNKGKGNGTLDPDLKNGSGGLVKIQIICVATSEVGSVNYNIDDLELGVKK
ncbi:MAG: CIA30 family protein [Candidatus Saganbacteria bacterium]|nr:CIA30 family protein [Candidatus Saganbacteria bacterium]